MGNKFSSGRRSIAICDRCGWQWKLSELRSETVKLKDVHNRVCPQCWDIDHPQLQLGMYPVEDPQAVRDPRPDTTYLESRAIEIFLTTGTYVVTQVGRATVTVT